MTSVLYSQRSGGRLLYDISIVQSEVRGKANGKTSVLYSQRSGGRLVYVVNVVQVMFLK